MGDDCWNPEEHGLEVSGPRNHPQGLVQAVGILFDSRWKIHSTRTGTESTDAYSIRNVEEVLARTTRNGRGTNPTTILHVFFDCWTLWQPARDPNNDPEAPNRKITDRDEATKLALRTVLGQPKAALIAAMFILTGTIRLAAIDHINGHRIRPKPRARNRGLAR